MTGRVHLIEVGGRGGVFQHTVGVAEALAAEGVPVVVHTADDAELTPVGVDVCACMHWVRDRPRWQRQAGSLANFAGRYLPHVLGAVETGDLAHVQGAFLPPATAGLIRSLRARGRVVTYSPHNTFARRRARLLTPSLRWAVRTAHATVAFSAADVGRLREWGVEAHLLDLVHHIPAPDEQRTQAWRETFGTRPVALMAGQIRADKRPDLLVRAVGRLGGGVRAVVVGDDRGGGPALRTAMAATASDALVLDRYLDLDDFVALLTAADVLVCPYEVASVSGPLAFARVLGVRTVATATGGLGEQAMVTATGASPEALADAISEALAQPPPAPRPYGATTARQHLDVYRAAGWSPSGRAGGSQTKLLTNRAERA